MFRTAASLLALTLTVSLAGPASAAPYDEGLSRPVEDSYYPTKGDPGVDTLHYGLDLRWNKKARVLSGTARIALRATATDSSFQLDLGDPLTVTGATLDGVPVSTTHTGKDLVVNAPVTAGQRYTLRVAYRGTPAPVKAPTSRTDMHGVGWHTTKTGQVWAMQEPFGAFTWYPVNDQPSDKALYDVRIDAPGSWVGVSNGQLVGRRTQNGRTVTRWHSSHPMASYLTTIAIGPYQRYRQTGPHGIPMQYWVPRSKPGMVKPLKQTPATLRWLESRLGRYPFDSVGIVVTPSQSAMETQTMMTFGAANYRYGVRDVKQTVAHELAHSWYGDTVTPQDWRDVWMNEGMATYVDTRFAVHKGWTTWRHWQREWKSDDQLWRDIYGPPGDYKKGYFASINVYYCTALMWDRLRIKLGTTRFNRLVRAWPQRHLDTNQTRQSFIDWAEARTGTELSAFFDKWLMSPKSPA